MAVPATAFPSASDVVHGEVLQPADPSGARLAVELRQCTALEILSLENNRLAAPVVDLSHATGLRSLQVGGRHPAYACSKIQMHVQSTKCRTSTSMLSL